MSESPLGKPTIYGDKYAPERLFAVSRQDARKSLKLGSPLPFSGTDIWNAWELTWLDGAGKPVIATASLYVDANSPNIIESKSLKLYINSLAMTRFTSTKDVSDLLTSDLSRVVESDVEVTIATKPTAVHGTIKEFPGICVDDTQLTSTPSNVDPALLRCAKDIVVREELHSHLFRSHCPVTNQPDIGSVTIRYRGHKISRSSLLTYIVSFRQHQDFHEACVERMFLDIKTRCMPDALTVYARFNRRGGLDINPFRTDAGETPENLRLWRQ